MTDLVGQDLGQYHVVEQIGKGGMATVYRATQASMKRDVAIKVLPRTLTHEDTFLERFYREVEIIASLQHPHILPVYDFGEYDGLPYIVMSYMSGGTLGDLITEGAMEPGVVRRITREMADALDYAHRKGIIHRDFKPGNVLLDEQGNTYLSDFGLAKVSAATMKITGAGVLGTPAYMSPEQSEPGDLTPAADVYALGVTLFQMLTGNVPYDAPSPLGVLMAHVTQPVPNIHRLRPELPPAVQPVIDKAMAKLPLDRYQTPGALAAALADALVTGEAAPLDIGEAMVMTNMLGQVIFVDHPCLRLLKRHHNEARSIIGKPLAEVLGIDKSQAEQLIHQVGRTGKVDKERWDVLDSRGSAVEVWVSGTATRDDKGGFVGADITLLPLGGAVKVPVDFDTMNRTLDTAEESFLQTYFTAQMKTLYESLVQLGGKKLGKNLEQIINETAQRNVWPVSMNDGQVSVQLRSTDADIYRALLAKAMSYAVSLIGKKMVMKGVQAVDNRMEPRIRSLVSDLRVDELFEVL